MTAEITDRSSPALLVEGLAKRFGGVIASDNLELDVAGGELHAVIGPNGAGKTTLIGQLAGEIRPDAGRIMLWGEDITRLPPHRRAARGLARSFQGTSIFRRFTAIQNVATAVQARAGHSFRFLGPVARDPALLQPARTALERVGLATRAEIPAGQLSHGEQRQLEIAMALAAAPRLLLLDEPAAGMSYEETQRLIELLRGLKGDVTMLLVEHDMDAVFALADRITVLVQGRAIATGTPEAVRADPEVRNAYLGEEVESSSG
jgi:branched-chain amino acid transport system ATP-binding protein